MLSKSILAGAVLGVLAVGSAAIGDVQRPQHQPGFMPWRGQSFGFIGGPFYGGGDASGPQQSQPQGQVYDIAPAVGQAAFADADFDNRWTDLQIMIDRARKDFQISADYMTARQQMTDAQHSYDAAVEIVLSRLHDDKQYHDLVEKQTEEQVAIKSTALGSGVRNSVATEKLQYASMVTQLEAEALDNDSTVQDARGRLLAASQNLQLKEAQFESQLYKDADLTAARQQMEIARANKAGANGFLQGALVTRADQLGLNSQNVTGNNVYLTGWNPYWRGYYGIGGY